MRIKLLIKILLILLLTIITTTSVESLLKKDWLENGNFYQIYVRSFKDSNNDGIGDLNGISAQLQYIKDLGMDGIILSPIFQSPMYDFGFDVSDYYQIQPEYGTINDLATLIKNAHRLHLKIILDFIPNHTSDKHNWFQLSVKEDANYKDFYIWHHGVLNTTTGQRHTPSNWLSVLRFSTWEWNEQRRQYYLHQFTSKEPELNLRNPAVRKAITDAMLHWLARGVDGFHIDTVSFLYEAEIDPNTGTYPDEPLIVDLGSCPDVNDYCHLQHIHTYSYPENVDLVYEWRATIDEAQKKNSTESKIIITVADTTFREMISMYGNEKCKGSHVPLNFELFNALTKRSTAFEYRYFVEHWLSNMPKGVFANWFLGNHNNPRIATRFGSERVDLMNILVQTLPGIAITYYGEELGMEDLDLTWEETVDPRGRNTNPYIYKKYSHDPQRTPFQWNNNTFAGFTLARKSWLPISPNYHVNNVATQSAAEISHIKVFKILTKLRKEEPAFSSGSFEGKVVDGVFLYKRQALNGKSFVVILNVSEMDRTLNLPTIFSGIQEQVTVVTSSIQSGVQTNQLVYSSVFVAKANLGYVVSL